MHARFALGNGQPSGGLLIRLANLLLLLLPATLLLMTSLRAPANGARILWLGTLVQCLGCLLALVTRQNARGPANPAMILLYVIALSWLVLGLSGEGDWFTHLTQATLLVIPLFLFAVQCLRDSGALALRRARQLAQRLSRRTDWPSQLLDCRLLPEVKALREALHVDASPALNLLTHFRSEVRVAALAALEFRQNWRPGQPQIVLHLAQTASEPEIRAGAINALANIDDRQMVETLAEFLHDPASFVRQTATEALLWNMEDRWSWVRVAVRKTLADPSCQEDGPLPVTSNRLGPEAIADLHAWAAEKGILSQRATLTLGAHYAHELSTGSDPALAENLRKQLIDPHTPSLLRLEMTRLLHQHRELNDDTLRHLLDPSLPAPVRLIAAEALLAQGPCPPAVAALHELARLPNREIALATADVVQRRLGVDLGLPRGPQPPLVSRMAAEVARRVLVWSSQQDYTPTQPAANPVNPPGGWD